MIIPALQFQCTLHKVLNGIGPDHPEWNKLDQQSYDAAMKPEVADCIERYAVAHNLPHHTSK